jgi:Uma2 family endonuclease
MSAVTPPSPPARSGPAWDIARLFPDQGAWDESDYLALSTNHLVEFSDGVVEVLPMPTMPHQLIVQYLSNLLLAFTSPRGLGRVLFAPLRVRLRENKYREPDIVFMLAEHAARMGRRYWDGADLVVEVVSDNPDDRERDLVVKRREYAEAGIREYWIVDPRDRRVTVLKLDGGRYTVHGEHVAGERASSALLTGFEADVSSLFAAAEE